MCTKIKFAQKLQIRPKKIEKLTCAKTTTFVFALQVKCVANGANKTSRLAGQCLSKMDARQIGSRVLIPVCKFALDQRRPVVNFELTVRFLSVFWKMVLELGLFCDLKRELFLGKPCLNVSQLVPIVLILNHTKNQVYFLELKLP